MLNKIRAKFGSKEGVLVKNTFMLYVLQFSTYILGIIVVPYETRILGKGVYGILGAATAVMVYFQLFIDFGFILSATEDISKHRTDREYISKVFTSVTINKLILTAVSAVALVVLCNVIENWYADRYFYYLFFIATAVNSLIPDYLYRGLEQMTVITVRTIIIKLFFTAMIFIFLKSPSDYYVVPILNIIGNTGALLGIYVHLFRKLKIKFIRCEKSFVWNCMKRSSTFFYSRIATTVYTASNTVLLSVVYPSGSAETGLYTSADKLITTGKNGLSPISDSLYPYMVKHRDYKMVKRIMMIIMPIIILGTAVLFVFSKPFCVLFFGSEFADVAPVLRSMLPIAIVILPSYLCGFPMLSAMNLSKHANYSVIFGSAVHILNLVILYFTHNFSPVMLGAATSLTETLILAYRLVVIYIHRDRLKTDKKEEGV